MQDVIILGAGILGSTIARYLSLHGLHVEVIDPDERKCAAGNALIQPGCFSLPNTKRSLFISKGYRMWGEFSQELRFSSGKIGAFVPCFSPQEMLQIREFHQRAKKNRITDLRILWSDVLKAKTNCISEEVYSSLYIPGTIKIDPYAYLEAVRSDASSHSCIFCWGEKALSVHSENNCFEVYTNKGCHISQMIINTAGEDACLFHNQFSDISVRLSSLQRKSLFGHMANKALPKAALMLPPSFIFKEASLIPMTDDQFELTYTEDSSADSSVIFSSIHRALPGIQLDSKQPVLTHTTHCISHGAKDVIVGEIAPGFYEATGFDTCGISAAPAVALYLTEQITQQITR